MFKNKKGQVRSGWLIALLILCFLAVITVISGICGVVLTNMLMISGDLMVDGSTVSLSERGMAINSQWQIILMFVQEIVIILSVWIAWKKCSKLPMSLMGMKSLKDHSKEFIAGLLIGFGSITVVFGINVLTGSVRIDSFTPHFSLNMLVYFVMFFMVAIAEEMLGRGYIMGIMRNRGNNKYVIFIVSMILFALLHSANNGMTLVSYLNLALIGGFLAYVYYKTGNLWLCIGYHLTWNFFQGLYGFPVSGTVSASMFDMVYENNNLINGGVFGPEGGIVVTVISILIIVCIYFVYKKSDYKFMEEDTTVNELIVENNEQLD